MLEDDLCFLGFVDSKQGRADSATAMDSKVGGKPIWHTPAAEEPRCRRCAGEMLFLAQIYAPTEVHRSLYIYCCSSSGCVLLSDGWRVIRNQRSSTDKEDEGEIEAASIPPADATPVACGQVPTFSSIFDANSWGDVGGDELDDLEALLRQRDDALLAAARATPQVAPTALPLPVSEAGVDNDCLLKAFVIWQAIEPDPRVRTRKEGQGASDEHIMAMMHRYIAEEKDSLQEEGSTPSDATSLRLIEESMKRAVDGGSDNDDDDDYDSDSEKQLVRKQSKTEAVFRARLSLAPEQVLRYAYGGVPMWCCDTPAATDAVTRKWAKSSAGLPAVISVPRCEACGGERLFEMQLMPALSDYLVERQPLASAAVDVCRLLKSSGINENKSEKSVGILDGLQLLKLSMGVLCVWSCEASCDGGSCEYTIFQPLD